MNANFDRLRHITSLIAISNQQQCVRFGWLIRPPDYKKIWHRTRQFTSF